MDILSAAVWVATYVSCSERIEHERRKGMYGDAVGLVAWTVLSLAKTLLGLCQAFTVCFMMGLRSPAYVIASSYVAINFIVHLLALLMATLAPSMDVATGNFGLCLLYLYQLQGFMVAKETMPDVTHWLIDINPLR
jgi:hypothetical protein